MDCSIDVTDLEGTVRANHITVDGAVLVTVRRVVHVGKTANREAAIAEVVAELEDVASDLRGNRKNLLMALRSRICFVKKIRELERTPGWVVRGVAAAIDGMNAGAAA